jgi:pimeloyl-ACP methyl ester carboxylesterase
MLMVLIMAEAGCQTSKLPPDQLDQGLVYMIPGIEGRGWSLTEARRAFRDAGVKSAIYTHKWKYPVFWLGNLMDYEANQQSSQDAADEIIQYQRQYPGRPVDVVGYSGGGGLAIMTAEKLSPESRVRNVILVHAAISPDYDLTGAINNINGQLVNLYSPNDWLVLGVGTQVFGTVDRKQVSSAGRVGFHADRAVPDERLRSKLCQQKWSAEMLRYGHWGGHLAIVIYQWNRYVIAPYLLSETNVQ